MALLDKAWYVNNGDGATTGYYSVTTRPQNTTVAAGALVRQASAPSSGSERCFVCIIAGTTANVADATWTVTRGAKSTDGTVTWQECTGHTAVNGDVTNTPNWTEIKDSSISLGVIIKRDNAASYQICTTAGFSGTGSEPAFSDTAGTTTADNTVTWTSLGVVGNFTGWQAPHARLKNALANTWGAAGNSFFVASEHVESQSTSLSLTSPSLTENPCKILCVTKTTVPPVAGNLTTGASISTTSTGSISINGEASYYEGITFNVGSGAVNTSMSLGGTSASDMCLKNCTINLVSTGSTSRIILGATVAINISLIDCVFSFSATGQGFDGGSFEGITAKIQGGSLAAGVAIPTSLFKGTPAYLIVEGVDLSQAGSGKTINGATTTGSGVAVFKNNKLGASVTKSGTPNTKNQKVYFVNNDSSGTNYTHEQYAYTGSHIVETTIVRTGGATDGITPISWKITTTANSKAQFPFEAMPMFVRNTTTASNVTVTVYGIWGGGAVPNNDDIWIEVSYMGSGSTPVATIDKSNAPATVLTANAAQTSDASSWGGSTTAFKMVVTLSSPQPALSGPIYVTVKAAKASSTFYIDPKIVLS